MVVAPSSRARAAFGSLQAIAPVIPVGVLFLIGLALQVFANRKANYDERLFLDVAQGILATGRPINDLTTMRPFLDHTFLYEYLLAIPTAVGNLLGGHQVLFGRAMTSLFGLATIPVVFLVGREVRGVSAGLIAATLVALNPYWLWLSWFIHMEVPMTFFLVVALYLLVRERPFLAGVAVAVAVLLKEIAFAFWLVAAAYVLVRHGPRRAAAFAIPALVAFAGWLAVSAAMDADRLSSVLGRWVGSVGGSSTWDERFTITPREWTHTAGYVVIGPLLTCLALATAAIAVVRRPRIPPIAWVAVGYSVLDVAVTYVVKLKEDRWLTPVIPMAALAIVLVVDWADLLGSLDRRGTRAQGADTPPSTAPL